MQEKDHEAVLDALALLDTMETVPEDWEIAFLESLTKHLAHREATSKEIGVLIRMVEQYLPDDHALLVSLNLAERGLCDPMG